MFCRKCGYKLEGKETFCPKCGCKITSLSSDISERKTESSSPVSSEKISGSSLFTVPEGKRTSSAYDAPKSKIKYSTFDASEKKRRSSSYAGPERESRSSSYAGPEGESRRSAYASPETDMVSPDFDHGKAEKKRHGKAIALIGISLLAALVIVVGALALTGKGLDSIPGVNSLLNLGEKDALVYVSDGKYELITDLKQDDPIEIDSSGADTGFMVFSPDKNYVYYGKNMDDDAETMTLCRAEYDKLKADSDKNDQYIETIADNVSYSIRLFGDGLTFIDDNGNLYYYDGEKAIVIGNDVGTYYQDEESSRIVYVTYDGEKDRNPYALYGVDLNDESAGEYAIELASEADSIEYISDFDNILYTVADEDDYNDMYAAGFDKKTGKVAEHVLNRYDTPCQFNMTDGKTYFLGEDDGEDKTPVYTIYGYDNGTVTSVQEDCHISDQGMNALAFRDDQNAEEQDPGEGLKVLLPDGTISDLELPDFVTDSMGDDADAILTIFSNDHIYLEYANEESSTGWAIASAEVKKGEIGEFTKVTDDGMIRNDSFMEDNFYYLSNKKTEGDDTSYDLYLNDGKEDKLLAEEYDDDSTIQFYENGLFIICKDADSDTQIWGECIIGNTDGEGETTLINDGVEEGSCKVLDEDRILYISDHELCCLDGSSSSQLKKDVNSYIAKDKVAISKSTIDRNAFSEQHLPDPGDEEGMSARELDGVIGIGRFSDRGNNGDTNSSTQTATTSEKPESTDVSETAISVTYDFSNVQEGDTITFGTYEQDGDTTDGAEDIEWRVLEKEEDKMLVISQEILDVKPWNTNHATLLTWEICSLREWLNNDLDEGFYGVAFTEGEKKQIELTEDETGCEDNVFLLSVDEAEELFESDEDRASRITAYAAGHLQDLGYNYIDEGEIWWWWLRSVGGEAGRAASVNDLGGVESYGFLYDDATTCVRPALYISLES